MYTNTETMITVLIGLLSFVVGLIAILIYQSQVNKNRRARNEGTFDNRFRGMTFVVIGKFQNFNSILIKAMIHSLDGKISSRISSRTTYVVAGEGVEDKIMKAQELGVPVIDEDKFIEMAK